MPPALTSGRTRSKYLIIFSLSASSKTKSNFPFTVRSTSRATPRFITINLSTPACLKLSLARSTFSGSSSIVMILPFLPTASANQSVENPADVPISNTRLPLIALRSIEKNTPVSAVIASISWPGAILALPFLSMIDCLSSRDITRKTLLSIQFSLFCFESDKRLTFSASSFASVTDCCCLYSWFLRVFQPSIAALWSSDMSLDKAKWKHVGRLLIVADTNLF